MSIFAIPICFLAIPILLIWKITDKLLRFLENNLGC